MAIDRQIVGEAAATFLDRLDAKYGDDAQLGAVMILVAVDRGEDGDTVEFSGHDGDGSGLSLWKAKGLLSLVNDSLRGAQ
ncbi:MAG TPA: hypothetical protein VIL49_18180 [Capillimicrobium sp.]